MTDGLPNYQLDSEEHATLRQALLNSVKVRKVLCRGNVEWPSDVTVDTPQRRPAPDVRWPFHA